MKFKDKERQKIFMFYRYGTPMISGNRLNEAYRHGLKGDNWKPIKNALEYPAWRAGVLKRKSINSTVEV